MNDETQQTDAGRLEKEEIEDLGTVTLARGGHVIHCLTVIGQIEGHSEAPQGQKTTKYEHVIPQLVAAQEDPRIEGLLVLLNTVGGDVEAGLALAELIARACNAQTGCFRLLDRTMNNVFRIMRENGSETITYKIIEQASSMMML